MNMFQSPKERFSAFDLEMIYTNRTQNEFLEVLIGSANTQRTRMSSYWVLEHVDLTSCFGFDFDLAGEQDSVHSEQSCLWKNSCSSL